MAEQLLAAGKAYHCYASPQELDRDARGRRARRGTLRSSYDGRWRDRDPKDAPPGVKPVIRLKAPLDGETVIEDRVQGRVVWQNADLDDMIILRSDGTPVYNHAVVVDDHDMGITHVIRGVDHLTNAARQVQIYKAMGWELPVFAHVPLIHGPDGAKLSKRHGAPGDRGLPRHGLSAGGPAELPGAARLEPRRRRDLLHRADDRVVRHRRHQQGAGPARLRQARRRQRPLHPPGERRRAAGRASRTSCPKPKAGRALAGRIEAVGWDKLAAALPSLKERAKTLKELVDGAGYLLASRPLALDDKAAKLLDAEARAILAKLLALFEASRTGRRRPSRPSFAISPKRAA